MSNKLDDYTGALFEVMSDDIKLILEVVQPLAVLPQKVEKLESNVGELNLRMTAVELAVKETNLELRNIDQRLSKLELQAA